jgi:subtilisin family serine protease
VIAPNKAAFNSALSDARSGTRVALTLAPVNAFVVNASVSDAQALARNDRVKVVRDHIEHLIRPGMYGDAGMIPPSQVDRQAVAKRLAATGHTSNPFSTPTAHQCYGAMQGTSMAVPHVAAVLALIAGAHPELAGQPAKLVKFLKSQAVTPIKSLVNATPPLSPTDVSNTELSNSACPGGYCHLGGKAIKANEAFGAGLVNAAKAVGAAGP